MNQRGRKSTTALALSCDERTLAPLKAPAGLTQAERGGWVELVTSRPADHFGTQHVPIMVEYVRNVCRSHVVDEQLRAIEPEVLATDEGLRRYDSLAALAIKISNIIRALATAMRLTQQA